MLTRQKVAGCLAGLHITDEDVFWVWFYAVYSYNEKKEENGKRAGELPALLICTFTQCGKNLEEFGNKSICLRLHLREVCLCERNFSPMDIIANLVNFPRTT